VGYSISDRMTAQLAVDAVTHAVVWRGAVKGCVVHADRGSQSFIISRNPQSPIFCVRLSGQFW